MIIPLTLTFFILATLQCTESFNVRPSKDVRTRNLAKFNGLTRLQLSEEQSPPQQPNQSQKLARLNAMAAKLRAEASILEVLITSTIIISRKFNFDGYSLYLPFVFYVG